MALLKGLIVHWLHWSAVTLKLGSTIGTLSFHCWRVHTAVRLIPLLGFHPTSSCSAGKSPHQLTFCFHDPRQPWLLTFQLMCKISVSHERLWVAAERQKRDHDTRVVQNHFSPRDLVLKRNHNHKKLETPWVGPFVVKKAMGDCLYLVASKQKTYVLHHDLLKPYTGSQVPRWVRGLPATNQHWMWVSCCALPNVFSCFQTYHHGHYWKKSHRALSTGVSDAPGRAIRRVCPSTSSPNTVTSWRLPTIAWFVQQSSPQRNHGGAIVLCQGIVSALSCGGKKQECQWDRGASPYSSKVTHLMGGPTASPTQTDFRPSSPRQDKSQMTLRVKIRRMKQKKRPPQRWRCQQ